MCSERALQGGSPCIVGWFLQPKMEYYLLLYFCLFSLGATSANGCQPVACSCKSETSGAVVNLTALDRHLIELQTGQPLALSNSTAQYYLQLCTPLNLPGDCSDSTVCKVDGSVYTSYGNAVSYSVNTASRAVLVMFNNGDTVGGTPRQVSVTIYCGHGSDSTVLNTATDTFLNFTIYTSLQCMPSHGTLPPPSITKLHSSGSPSPAPPTTASSLPPSPTVTPATTSPSTTTSPSVTSTTTSPSVTSATPPPTVTPTTTSPSVTPAPPHTSMSAPATESLSSLLAASTYSGSALPPSPSHPTPPQSSSNPVQPSSSPQPACDCENCSKQLAVGLGVAIPSSAIVTLIATLLFCFCCLKTRKGSNYMRLAAPSVAFDEEDRD